jgi:hypothetical protein
LQNEIFEQPADVIVGEGGANGGFESETAAETACDVVFAAALPNFEFARGPNATFAGIEPQHNLAEGDQIIFARTGRFDLENGHKLPIVGGMDMNTEFVCQCD